MSEKRLPVWLMGLCNLPFGIFGGASLVTMPQLLAADHVPEPRIAAITAITLAASFTGFVFAPILDWRFTRRFYAIVMAVLAALLLFAAFLCKTSLVLLPILLFFGLTAAWLNLAAIGGWFAALTTPEDKGKLGAWFALANVCGGGMTAIIAISLLRDLPYVVGAAAISLVLLAPLPLFAWLRAPPADSRLAGESFAMFFRDVMQLLKKRSIWWTLLLFALPSASFALTNILSGLGGNYHASEKLVGLVCGAGSIVAGVIGSLIVPRIIGKLPPLPLYLTIGGLGGLFTLALVVLPHTPAVFAMAWLLENLFQAAAFAVENTLILREVGEDNPLASTQYAVLYAAPCLPIAYMGAVDGWAYGTGGIDGSFLVDGGLGVASVVVLALLFRFVRRKTA